jgi:hypothetical protein
MNDVREKKIERITQATLKRNVERPEIPWEIFDGDRIPPQMRPGLEYFLVQLYYTEAIGPQNLATLAEHTPVTSLKSAYLAQCQDEHAHAAFFRRYLTVHLGRKDLSPDAMTVAACNGGRVVQHDPVVGLSAVTMGIEYFACALIDALVPQIEEPLLLALFAHLRKDEERHKALARAALRRLLPNADEKLGRMDRVRLKAGRAAVEAFMRHVICPVYQRRMGTLELPMRRLYEQSLDEISPIFEREMALAVAAS